MTTSSEPTVNGRTPTRDHTHPLGPLVDAHPAKRPERTTLRGRTITLVPLDAEAHADAIFRGSAGGEKDHAWTYLPYGPYSDPAVFKASLTAKAQPNDPLFFAILDNSTGEAIGHQALHRIEPTQRVIEVGHILYTPGMQRTIGATEAQYLFAAYVFDALGYRCYEWRCDDLNAASKRAAARFGFTFEGVFRQHMIIKGRNRDTAWFSMLDSEWPARRAAFRRWLDAANFDAEGRQKVSLTSLHAG
jgi:RimJ/RimL family protein N-acetyltransferase